MNIINLQPDRAFEIGGMVGEALAVAIFLWFGYHVVWPKTVWPKKKEREANKTHTEQAKKVEDGSKRWNKYTILQGLILVVIIILVVWLLVRS